MEALTALNSLRMKEPFVRFLNDAYLDTEHVLSSSEDNRSILTLFQAFRLDVDNLVSDEYVDPEEASYVTTAVLPSLSNFSVPRAEHRDQR